jgi:hypothetical protein
MSREAVILIVLSDDGFTDAETADGTTRKTAIVRITASKGACPPFSIRTKGSCKALVWRYIM